MKVYLGHDDDVLPRNVVLFECLPKNTLRLSVGVNIGRVKGIDTVVVSECNEDTREWWSLAV